MADSDPSRPDPLGWLRTVGAAQVQMIEGTLDTIARNEAAAPIATFWRDGLKAWSALMATPPDDGAAITPSTDKRFKDPAWNIAPFAQMRHAYETATAQLMAGVTAAPGLDEGQRERLRFSAQMLADAMSPSNFPWTNPQVLARTAETGGDNLLKGMEHLLADVGRGQLTHVATDRFELGRDLATTPGKVVKRTALYELIQYAPTTDMVLSVPLVIFPPWINRFYILDLTPEKSFIRWAVGEGLSVFMVSWKSADAGRKDVTWDD